MVVVYDTETGDIIYTAEKRYNDDFIEKENNQGVIITDNEKIRAHKHKVDLNTKSFIPKGERGDG